MAVKGF